MTTETEGSAGQSFEDMFPRKLKNVSAAQLENAFAKALLDLTGQDYKVDLHSMDWNPEQNSWFNDSALLAMKITKDAGDSGLFGAQPSGNEPA